MELLLAVVFTIIITRPCARLGAEDRKKIKGHSSKGSKPGTRPIGMQLELPLFSENRILAIL